MSSGAAWTFFLDTKKSRTVRSLETNNPAPQFEPFPPARHSIGLCSETLHFFGGTSLDSWGSTGYLADVSAGLRHRLKYTYEVHGSWQAAFKGTRRHHKVDKKLTHEDHHLIEKLDIQEKNSKHEMKSQVYIYLIGQSARMGRGERYGGNAAEDHQPSS